MITYKQINKYEVLVRTGFYAEDVIRNFNVAIAEKIEEGWQPYAEMRIIQIPGGKVLISQAMVKGYVR